MSNGSGSITSTSSAPQTTALGAVQTWIMALDPSAQNYQRIAADPRASARRAYLWLFGAAVLGTLLVSLTRLVLPPTAGPSLNSASPGLNQPAPTLGLDPLSLVVVLPLTGVIVLAVVTVQVGGIHLLARALGGVGAYGQFLYVCSAYLAPWIGVAPTVSRIPLVGPVVVGLMSLYSLLLLTTATKAVHHLSSGRTLVVTILLPILIVFAGLFGLSLIGSALGGLLPNLGVLI